MFQQLSVAARMLLVLTVLTGIVYPLVVTALAQLCFPSQANGSLIVEDGRVRGSRLVGQVFDEPRYFWSRPSATSPAYNASASSGSNLGPTNPALIQAVAERVLKLRATPGGNAPIPVDLVTASGSGLDPHISVAAAMYQLPRVARVRGMKHETLYGLIARHTDGRQFGFLGEPAVNVLELNIALDVLTNGHGGSR